MLEAGQSHQACDVVIPWPLKLMGSGTAAEATVVLCPKGPDAALDFRYCLLHASGCIMYAYSACQSSCLSGSADALRTLGVHMYMFKFS